jgi:hypothetical protein
MNRKGISIEYLVGAIIAIAVLVVVLGFLIFGWGSSFADTINNLIPSFNKSIDKIEGFEYLRYNLSGNNVQYYSGVEWKDFGKDGIVKLNDKLVSVDIKTQLEDYYYKRQADLDLKGNIKIVKVKMFSDDKDFIFLSGKSITFEGRVESSYGIDKFYVLSNEDIFLRRVIGNDGDYFEELDGVDSSDFRLKEELIIWRDSILNRPVKLTYQEEDSEVTLSYCVEKKDKIYLVVDLSKPANGDVCT